MKTKFILPLKKINLSSLGKPMWKEGRGAAAPMWATEHKKPVPDDKLLLHPSCNGQGGGREAAENVCG